MASTVPTECVINGTPSMYGLGIRLSFYLLWYALILAHWLAPTELVLLRPAHLFVVAAVALALVIRAAEAATSAPLTLTDSIDPASFRAAEIYIEALLLSGTFYFRLPLYVWRGLTMCRPEYDPQRRASYGMGTSPRHQRYLVENENAVWPCVVETVLLLVVMGFQLWFWWSGVGMLWRDGCNEFGFFFGKLTLDSSALKGFNGFVDVVLILGALVAGSIASGIWVPPCVRRRKRRMGAKRLASLREIQTVFNLAVSTTAVAAVELTIQWNDITGVNIPWTADQLIPLLASAVLFVRLVHTLMRDREEFPDSNGAPAPGEKIGSGTSYFSSSRRTTTGSARTHRSSGGGDARHGFVASGGRSGGTHTPSRRRSSAGQGSVDGSGGPPRFPPAPPTGPRPPGPAGGGGGGPPPFPPPGMPYPQPGRPLPVFRGEPPRIPTPED